MINALSGRLAKNGPPQRLDINRRTVLKGCAAISAIAASPAAAFVRSQRETALAILPLDEVQDPEFARIARRAKTLLLQMQDGLNYFGQPRNFVYQLSLDEFQRVIDGIIPLTDHVNTDYELYSKADQFLAHTETALRSAIAHTNTLKQKQTDQLANTREQITTLQNLIIQMRNDIDVAHSDVLAKQQGFDDAVKKATMPTCSITNVLAVVGTIASLASGVGTFVTAATAATTALTNHGLALVNVSKTVAAFRTAMDDANDINQKYLQLRSQLASKPDSAMILLNEGDLDKMVANFDEALKSSPASGTPEAHDFHDAVHRYVDIVKARNQKILDRDNLIGTTETLTGELADRDAEIQNFSDQLSDATRQDHSDFTVRLAVILRRNIESLRLSIWEEIRSLELFTLNDLSASYSVSTAGLDTSQALTQLTAVHAQIKNDYLSGEVGLPGAAADLAPQPVTIILTNDQQRRLATRSTAGTYDISFSVALADFPMELTEVFASKVQIILLDRNSSPVRFGGRLIHTGYAVFKRSNGDIRFFTHMPRTSPVQISNNNAPISLGFSETKYVGLSPFTTWCLRVGEVEEQRNISEVVAIRMVFEGKCRGLV
jgi:hypothetical protein